jgi:hypothetical protein
MSSPIINLESPQLWSEMNAAIFVFTKTLYNKNKKLLLGFTITKPILNRLR